MNNFSFILSLSLILTSVVSTAQENNTLWNGKESAVVLSYDDALNVHLDIVMPQLEEQGFYGTFYVPPKAETMHSRQADWRAAATIGHELGNHTLFHPCDGSKEGREWVESDYDLSTYSVNRITNEIIVANAFLQAIDGKTERTFAYTCGDVDAGGISFVDTVKKYFPAARGVTRNYNVVDSTDWYNINCFSMKGHSGEEMIQIVEQGIKNKALTVFLFHGVGGEHSLNVDEEAHQMLIDYLQAQSDKVWIGTMLDATKLLKNIK